jgi:hypothetical protein
MPTKSNATTNWKPKRTCDGGDIGGGGRSILADVERVSREDSGRSATSLGKGAPGKGKC